MKNIVAEFFGTAGLLTVVVGSGIMGENLAQGNTAIALLANSLATGAGLFVLIQALGPISGAHFNPVVSLVVKLKKLVKDAVTRLDLEGDKIRRILESTLPRLAKALAGEALGKWTAAIIDWAVSVNSLPKGALPGRPPGSTGTLEK